MPDALAANTIWFFHGSPAFSPDGSEMFFVRYPTDEHQHMEIRVTGQVNGRWSEPERAPFSSDLAENSPAFSIDGNRLFYVSELPADRHKVVTRSGDGWSSPQSVAIPIDPSAYPGWQLSIARNETLYFELQFDGHYDLYSSELVDGAYTTPESLGEDVNSDYNDFAPYVDSDEDYIIFTSQRPGGLGESDLYISFSNEAGGWLPAINMGSPINSGGADAWPYVSPDGDYFFFVSSRQGDAGFNPYWVDAQILADLRAGAGR